MSKMRGYRRIANAIMRYVAENALPPNARLPSEKKLAMLFGVSRPIIREAVIALEITGEIEVRRGAGLYVGRASNAVAVMLESNPGPSELLRARLLIEGEAAGEAAGQACNEDLAELATALEDMRHHILAGESSLDADRRFHMAIAHGSGNSTLVLVIDALWNAMASAQYRHFSRTLEHGPQQLLEIRDHEEILAAIERRSPADARKFMRRHLAGVQERASLFDPDAKLQEEHLRLRYAESSALRVQAISGRSVSTGMSSADKRAVIAAN